MPVQRAGKTMPRHDVHTLTSLLAERILVLDGATGTQMQALRLGEADSGAERSGGWPIAQGGLPDPPSLTSPDVVRGIHRASPAAGADIIETNTFNAPAISPAAYERQPPAIEITREAARL